MTGRYCIVLAFPDGTQAVYWNNSPTEEEAAEDAYARALMHHGKHAAGYVCFSGSAAMRSAGHFDKGRALCP